MLRPEDNGYFVPSEEKTDTFVFPASFSQQRLWLLSELDAQSPVYTIARAFRVRGNLQPTILEQTLQYILDRHEALRTHFIEENGEPKQVISSSASLPYTHISLEGEEQEKREQRIRSIVQEEATKPFDLTKGPLLRIKLIRLSASEHILTIAIHHIVFDGWSMGLLMKEITEVYTALSQGQPIQLPELPIQYADYTVWQREWLQGELLDKQLNYWKKQLEGELPVLQLPLARPRPPIQSFKGAVSRFELSPALSQALEALSKQEGVTLFMTLLAAFQTLLYRYSGQQDMVVGTPIANRHQEETEGLIGFFVNTLAIRTTLTPSMTFREILAQVRKVALEAFEHQDLPFDKLVEELKPERQMSHSPVFQVMFALQNADTERWSLPELELTPYDMEKGTAKFDLTLYMEKDQGLLKPIFEYNTDLWQEATIQRMAEHWRLLLEGIVHGPDQAIDSLPILTSEERKQLLEEWNATAIEYPSDQTLHSLLEQQAERTPDFTAVVYQGESLTYRELHEQANQLAHYLRQHGVGPDVPVAVCLDRSIQLIVSLLGILKAGGAFLPLDTEAPSERLLQIIQGAEAPICITQQAFEHKLSVQRGVQVLSLDSEWETIQTLPTVSPESGVAPDHLVSIYFTSGSTGTPKGVANTHRGWVNRMAWMQRYHVLQEQETTLQKTVLTFDDSAIEIFWPLLYGGRLALMEPGLHRDPRAILDAAIAYKVVALQFVPSMLSMVLDTITEEDRERLDQLRIVVSSGEALRSEVVELFTKRMRGTLYNTWGATEVSIDSTIHRCSEEDCKRGGVVSVGRPLDNNTVYILDKQLQPVPIGVVGDLYLGGIGLARGYYKDEARTQKAFIPHPFQQGERLYKTGDRGCYLADGLIQFMGREDHQVKIRGMRVELGEIEHVLAKHPAVGEVVVIPWEGKQGDKRLVAYIIPVIDQDERNTGGQDHQAPIEPTVTTLRSYLKEKLPEYMVPSAMVFLDQLPLSPNGKINRQALPEPDLSRPELEECFVAPSTSCEQTLAEIWSEVLGIERIGVHDSFFELGGHSLLATQVASRIRKVFQIPFPLRVLFEQPTIAQLALVIEEIIIQEIETVG